MNVWWKIDTMLFMGYGVQRRQYKVQPDMNSANTGSISSKVRVCWFKDNQNIAPMYVGSRKPNFLVEAMAIHGISLLSNGQSYQN